MSLSNMQEHLLNVWMPFLTFSTLKLFPDFKRGFVQSYITAKTYKCL